MKISVKIDLSKLEDKEIELLKQLAVKSYSYDDATIIRAFQRGWNIVNKPISGNKD
jgi:hypothetical protein